MTISRNLYGRVRGAFGPPDCEFASSRRSAFTVRLPEISKLVSFNRAAAEEKTFVKAAVSLRCSSSARPRSSQEPSIVHWRTNPADPVAPGPPDLAVGSLIAYSTFSQTTSFPSGNRPSRKSIVDDAWLRGVKMLSHLVRYCLVLFSCQDMPRFPFMTSGNVRSASP